LGIVDGEAGPLGAELRHPAADDGRDGGVVVVADGSDRQSRVHAVSVACGARSKAERAAGRAGAAHRRWGARRAARRAGALHFAAEHAGAAGRRAWRRRALLTVAEVVRRRAAVAAGAAVVDVVAQVDASAV